MTRVRGIWADRIRAERKARGWDKPEMARQLARAAGESRDSLPSHQSLLSYVKRWERGVVGISERYRLLYARAFGLAEQAIFEAPEEDMELHRREFVAASLATGFAFTIPTRTGASSPGESSRSAADITSPSVGIEDVQAIRAMLDALTVSDRQFGGGHARKNAIDYLASVVQPLLHSSGPEKVLKDLYSVAVEFILRTASMNLDAGDTRTSRALLTVASCLAHQADDLTLEAWVLARLAEQEIHDGVLARRAGEQAMYDRHIERALAYTDGAVAMARKAPPHVRAFIGTKRALSVSMTGDVEQTEKALGDVRDAYGASRTVGEPAWMNAYDWGHLRHEEARCYTHLGLGDKAVLAATDPMRVRAGGRPRAFTLGVRAIGHVHANEIEQACEETRELIALADRLASDRVILRLADVMEALQPHEDAACVRDVLELAHPVLHRSRS